MKNNIELILIFTISLYHNTQAKMQNNKQSQSTITQKIIKANNSQKFIDYEVYADLKTSPLNRPNIETKQELFSPPAYKKQNHYNAPNMNEWASDNPSVRTCEIGTLNIMNKSFPLKASCRANKDPFKKPLPGPR